MAIDLSKMNEKELDKLRDDIDRERESRQKSRRSDARKAAEDAARKFGFSLDEVLGGGKAPKKPASPPKYRNPDDETQTWSGRGRQPEWYKAAMASGADPQKLAV